MGMSYIEVEKIIWYERRVKPNVGGSLTEYSRSFLLVDYAKYEPFIQVITHENGPDTFHVLADSDTLRDRLTTVCYDARTIESNWGELDTGILYVSKCDEVRFYDNNTVVIKQTYVAQDDQESYDINQIASYSTEELHDYIKHMSDEEINEIVSMHPDEVTSGIFETLQIMDYRDYNLHLKKKIEQCRNPILGYYIEEMRENQIEIYTRLSIRRARLFDVDGAINTTVGALPGFHNTVLLEQIIRYQVFVSDDNQLREDIERRMG